MKKYGKDKDLNIRKDVKFGEEGERKLMDVLSKHGDDVEVKRDRMVHDTFNLFIETMSRGMPSGITTTKAHWWAFLVAERNDEVMFIVSTKRLRGIINKKLEGNRLLTVKGGDRDPDTNEKTSVGHLISVLDLLLYKGD